MVRRVLPSCAPHTTHSLLQDSGLICRFAALRAAALPARKTQPTAVPAMYGPGLQLADACNVNEEDSAAGGGGKSCAVTGGDAAVEELERRLGDIMGVEVSVRVRRAGPCHCQAAWTLCCLQLKKGLVHSTLPRA
jgi:hypothetical protein